MEYSVLAVVAITALTGMALFLRKGVSAKWKEAGDSFGYGRQYENGSSYNVTNNIKVSDPWKDPVDYDSAESAAASSEYLDPTLTPGGDQYMTDPFLPDNSTATDATASEG